MIILARHLLMFVLMQIGISGWSLANDNAKFIPFNDVKLSAGREIWMENCMGCHAYGIAGAPIPMQPSDWRQRLKQERSVLYEHAINGFFGPDDTMMPERGGNPDLSDEQVQLAVDYMVELAKFYINKSDAN